MMRGVPMVSSEDSAWDVPPSIFGTRSGGPTVQRLVLGSQLHRLRESRGITAEQAAESIRGSHSKISRMEHGRVGFKERDVADLLTLYGVTDAEERAALLNLAREANTPGWWHAYSDILPSWLEPFVGLEPAASRVRLLTGASGVGARSGGGARPTLFGFAAPYRPAAFTGETFAGALSRATPGGVKGPASLVHHLCRGAEPVANTTKLLKQI